MDKPVYVVLEEDGTEVDEEEYFQTLPGVRGFISRCWDRCYGVENIFAKSVLQKKLPFFSNKI
jgi:hypothetical protein